IRDGKGRTGNILLISLSFRNASRLLYHPKRRYPSGRCRLEARMGLLLCHILPMMNPRP
ncbi:hypothetical protein ACHAO5_008950, partial [Verticillium nonalfalfae]